MENQDSGIEFGQLQHQQIATAVRPDHDRQYAVVATGPLDPTDLPIFVDFDVMRDMEAHARSNTQVELGGVLLGGQFQDADGNPFVVISEALRAEHYEATRGSFKFTHDTWEQITRDRDHYNKDLQLVGWYHTHPDWSVFLSGMDLFICENFFNKKLDVDLVIDPCRGDRGWFFWQGDSDGTRQKKQTDGFYLMTNRFRDGELRQFASTYRDADPTYFDSRYFSSPGDSTVQPIVHLHDQRDRNSWQGIATLGMLTIQFLVFAFIGYKLLTQPSSEAQNDASRSAHQNEAVYDSILGHLLAPDSESKDLIGHFKQIQHDNEILTANIEGQALLHKEIKQKLIALELDKRKLTDGLAKQKAKGVKLTEEKRTLAQELVTLKGDTQLSWWQHSTTWGRLLLAALLTSLLGTLGGYFWGRFAATEQLEQNSYPDGDSAPPFDETLAHHSESPTMITDDEDVPVRDAPNRP